MAGRLTPQSSGNKLNVSIRACLLFMCHFSRHCPINFLCLRNGNISQSSYVRAAANANPNETRHLAKWTHNKLLKGHLAETTAVWSFVQMGKVFASTFHCC